MRRLASTTIVTHIVMRRPMPDFGRVSIQETIALVRELAARGIGVPCRADGAGHHRPSGWRGAVSGSPPGPLAAGGRRSTSGLSPVMVVVRTFDVSAPSRRAVAGHPRVRATGRAGGEQLDREGLGRDVPVVPQRVDIATARDHGANVRGAPDPQQPAYAPRRRTTGERLWAHRARAWWRLIPPPAQCRERARIRSEKGHRWGRPEIKKAA
jgi:hypothetical protein